MSLEPPTYKKPMNLSERIAHLVERSKHLSNIQWLPYSGPHSQIIADINTALASAESEEIRFLLFSALLPFWTTNRNTEAARQMFGDETVWKYDKPLVLAPVFPNPGERNLDISINCGQCTVCRITGAKELLELYHQEVTASGHTITLAELNRRQTA